MDLAEQQEKLTKNKPEIYFALAGVINSSL